MRACVRARDLIRFDYVLSSLLLLQEEEEEEDQEQEDDDDEEEEEKEEQKKKHDLNILEVCEHSHATASSHRGQVGVGIGGAGEYPSSKSMDVNIMGPFATIHAQLDRFGALEDNNNTTQTYDHRHHHHPATHNTTDSTTTSSPPMALRCWLEEESANIGFEEAREKRKHKETKQKKKVMI